MVVQVPVAQDNKETQDQAVEESETLLQLLL